MKLSILIPTRNRSRYLAKLLSSVVTVSGDFEFVICDNASVDQTAKVCEHYAKKINIRYQYFPVLVSAVENIIRGLASVHGDHVWIMGDDDFINPEFLREYLVSQVGCCVVIPLPADKYLQVRANCAELDRSAAPLLPKVRFELASAGVVFEQLGTWITYLGAFIYDRQELIAGLLRHHAPEKINDLSFAYINIDIIGEVPSIQIVYGAIVYRGENSGGYSMFATWVSRFLGLMEYAKTKNIPEDVIERVKVKHEQRFLPAMAVSRHLGRAFCKECRFATLWSSPLSLNAKISLWGIAFVTCVLRVDLSLIRASAVRLRQLVTSDGLLGALGLLFALFFSVGRALGLRLVGLRLASIGADYRIKGSRHIRIEKSSSFGRRLWLEAIANHRRSIYSPKISIGSGVSFNDDVHIASVNSVSIGNDCLLGSRIIVTDHNYGSYGVVHESDPLSPPSERALVAVPVQIGARTWIGDGVVILPGTIVGGGSVIGANSVVKGIFPENSLIVGSPAKIIKRYSFLAGKWMACPFFEDLIWDDQ